MTFVGFQISAASPAALAAALVLGEALGFAAGPLAVLWPWAAAAAVWTALAAYGCGARRLLLPCMCAVGALLAMRTEASLLRLLDDNARSAPMPLDLTVESPVRLTPRTKRRRVPAKHAQEFSSSTGIQQAHNRPDSPKDSIGSDTREATSYLATFRSRAGPLPLNVAIPLAEPLPDGMRLPAVGEVWRCTGWLSRTRTGHGAFACRTLWMPSADSAVRLDRAPSLSPAALYAAVGENLAQRAAAGLSWRDGAAGLNGAILLGRRADIPRAQRETFVAAGTVHVFAISGLHVMLVAVLLAGACRRFGVPRRALGPAVVPLLAAYVILTGLRASAVRAALMAAIYLLGPTFGRRPDALSAYALTALIVYAQAPERLFDAGCTLSFAVMAGIVAWTSLRGRPTPPPRPNPHGAFSTHLLPLWLRIRLSYVRNLIHSIRPMPLWLCTRLSHLQTAMMSVCPIPLWLRIRLLHLRTAILSVFPWPLGIRAHLSRLTGYTIWRLKRAIAALAADAGVSAAAWAAGLPIVAHLFGQVSLGGLIANVFVVRLAKWTVALGFSGIVASFICLPLAVTLNALSGLSTEAMEAVSHFVASFPFASFKVHPWPVWMCLLWYAALAVVFLLAKALKERRRIL